MEIQEGNTRAKYGDAVLEKLSKILINEFGKVFSKRNLKRMRRFYMCFPIATTMMSQLSWTRYLEIIRIDEELISTKKNEIIVKYTLPEDNKNIFSTEYKLHLPTEQELINAVEEEKLLLQFQEIDNKLIKIAK